MNCESQNMTYFKQILNLNIPYNLHILHSLSIVLYVFNIERCMHGILN
jgi:hypothetical protein